MKPLFLSVATNLLLWFFFSVGAQSFFPWNWSENERWLFVGLCIASWAGFFMADKIGRDVARWEREEQEKKIRESEAYNKKVDAWVTKKLEEQKTAPTSKER